MINRIMAICVKSSVNFLCEKVSYTTICLIGTFLELILMCTSKISKMKKIRVRKLRIKNQMI